MARISVQDFGREREKRGIDERIGKIREMGKLVKRGKGEIRKLKKRKRKEGGIKRKKERGKEGGRERMKIKQIDKNGSP